jgi:hypothetical protein
MHRYAHSTARLLLSVLLCLMVTAPLLAQDAPDQPLPVVDFTVFEGNPVLTRGEADDWDGGEGMVFAPQVIKADGVYYLFYSGTSSRLGHPASIGFATSTDGVTWTKFEGNPILEPDGEGFDAMCISSAVPFYDGETWTLYYASNSTPCYGPGRYIGRATAPSPEGPWTRDAEPLLEAGGRGEWDEDFIMPHAVIHVDDGYLLYYSGGEEYLVPLPRRVGMATSPDGLTWTKCNDPETIDSPCAESDPIYMREGESEYVPFDAWSVTVLHNGENWEMFFSSTCPELVSGRCPAFIGYATSDDGVYWTTYINDEEPRILMPGQEGTEDWHRLSFPTALIEDDGGYRVYFNGCPAPDDNEVTSDCTINVATGTIVFGE